MPRSIVESVFIGAPPETVWRLYDDPALLRGWAPNVREARLVGDGPKAVGSRVEVTLTVMGIEQRLTEEVVRYDPPRAATQRGHSSGMFYDMTIRLQPEGRGTWCDYSCTPIYEGLMQLLAPIGDRVNRAMLRSALRSLKAAAERAAGPPDGARAA
jgi:uncharacterized protein YndB with AHSA1/START domain